MRLVLPFVILLGVLAAPRTADARIHLINTEDQIADLGPIPDDLAPAAAADGYDRVGFFYHRVATLGADLWSWSGTMVLYRKTPKVEFQGLRTVETTYYVEVPDELVDRHGWSVPIGYRIPIGLVIVLSLVELGFVARRKRRAKVVLVIGIAIVALSAVLLLLGMSWPIAIPMLVGLFHITASLPFFQPATTAEAALAMEPAVEPTPAPEPRRTERRSEPLMPPPPSFEKDPFRAPPQPPPIVVSRAPVAPAAAPIVHDASADTPKLLR